MVELTLGSSLFMCISTSGVCSYKSYYDFPLIPFHILGVFVPAQTSDSLKHAVDLLSQIRGHSIHYYLTAGNESHDTIYKTHHHKVTILQCQLK